MEMVRSGGAGVMAIVAQGMAVASEAQAGTLGAIREVAERVGASTAAFHAETASLKREIVEVKADMERRDLAGRSERADMTSLIHEMRSLARGAGVMPPVPVAIDLAAIHKIEHLCDSIEMFADAFALPLSEAPDGLKWLIKIQSWLVTLSKRNMGEMPLLDEESLRDFVSQGKLSFSQEFMLRNSRLSERLRVNYMALRRAFPAYDPSRVLLERIKAFFPSIGEQVTHYDQRMLGIVTPYMHSAAVHYVNRNSPSRWRDLGYGGEQAKKFIIDINLPLEESLGIIKIKAPRLLFEQKYPFELEKYINAGRLYILRADVAQRLEAYDKFQEALSECRRGISKMADAMGIKILNGEGALEHRYDFNITDPTQCFLQCPVLKILDERFVL